MLNNKLFSEVVDCRGVSRLAFPLSFLESIFKTRSESFAYCPTIRIRDSFAVCSSTVTLRNVGYTDEQGSLKKIKMYANDDESSLDGVILTCLGGERDGLAFIESGKVFALSGATYGTESVCLDATRPETFVAYLLKLVLGHAIYTACDMQHAKSIIRDFKKFALISPDFFDLASRSLVALGVPYSERPETTSSDFIDLACEFISDYDFLRTPFLRYCPVCGRYERSDSFEAIFNGNGCAIMYVCSSCAEVISRKCGLCGRRHPVSDFVDVEYRSEEGLTKRSVCNACAKNRFVSCTKCGELWYNSDITDIRSSDGRRVVESLCPACFSEDEENFAKCPHCDEYYENDEKFTKTSNGESVCQDCIEGDYFLCEDCNEYCPNDELVTIDGDRFVCESCFESGSYATCESCGEAHHTEDMYYHEGEGYYCQRCEDEREPEDDEYCGEIDLINPYSYKPSPKFHRAENDVSNLFLGVELEYNFDSQSDCNDAVQEIEDNGNAGSLFYYKHDSSLTNGCEFVSHPATLAYWKGYGIKNNIFKYLGSADVCDHTGLHIHISRKHMTDPHKIRINAFVYKNTDLLKFLARRDESSYAKFKKIELGSIEDSCDQNDRYEALNWYNDSTLEFRLFKSTTDEKHFLSCLEFCHASYIFTKTQIGIAELMNKDEKYVLDKFVKFVSNDTRYKELKNELAKFCSKK